MKRQKLEKGAHSSKHETSTGQKTATKRASDNESVQTDKPIRWDLTVFAWMNKWQFSNWLQRKQHGAKLASNAKGEKSPDKYTPESVRRLSERLLRRVKKRIRQSSRSSSKSPVPDFDFDDLDLESNLQVVPFGQEEESHSCVSKNQLQDNTLGSLADVNDTVENCTVHSDEHVSLLCTVESEDVHRNVQNAADVCKEVDTTDLVCDEEVSIILESYETEVEPLSSKVLDEEIRDTTISQTECDVHSNGPGTGSEDIDVESCVTGEIISVHGKGKVSEDSVGKLLDPSTDKIQPYLSVDHQGNDTMVSGVANSSEKIGEGEDKLIKEQISVSNDSLLSEAEVKDFARSGEQPSVLSTRDSATKDVMQIIQSTCEGSIANNNGHACEVLENGLVDNNLTSSGMMVDEEVSLMDTEKSATNMTVSEKEVNQDKKELLQETLSSNLPCQALSVADAEKTMGDASVSKHQPDLSVKRLADGSLDKAPLAIQAADKTEEPNAASASKSPFVVTSILGPDQVNQYLSRADVSQSLGSSGVGTSQTTAISPFTAPVTTRYPVIPPPPQNFLWSGIAPRGPFPTAEIMPVHSSMQHPNYGYPSWANHAPHVPFPVGCTQSSTASDDICPPGTEGDSLKLNSKPTGSEISDVHENTDENQPHGSVMDQSVVTALMQFYSEISEVEGGVKNDNEKVKSDETKASGSIPKPQELTGNKQHEVSDMEMESDFDGSHMDVSDVDIAQIEEVTENAANFDGPIQKECSIAELESAEKLVKQNTLAEDITVATTATVSGVLVSTVDTTLAEKPAVCSTLSSTVDALQIDNTAVSGDVTLDLAPLMRNPANGTDAGQLESLDVFSPLAPAADMLLVDSPIVETPTGPFSPIDAEFLANAEQTIFSSIGDLRNLLGQSSSFDRIAEEAITSTVSSLEEILRQAQGSYLELSSCPSDSGVSTSEEVSHPFKLSSSVPVPVSPVQDSTKQTYTLPSSCSVEETASKGLFVWHIWLFFIQNTVEPPVSNRSKCQIDTQEGWSFVSSLKCSDLSKTKKLFIVAFSWLREVVARGGLTVQCNHSLETSDNQLILECTILKVCSSNS